MLPYLKTTPGMHVLEPAIQRCEFNHLPTACSHPSHSAAHGVTRRVLTVVCVFEQPDIKSQTWSQNAGANVAELHLARLRLAAALVPTRSSGSTILRSGPLVRCRRCPCYRRRADRLQVQQRGAAARAAGSVPRAVPAALLVRLAAAAARAAAALADCALFNAMHCVVDAPQNQYMHRLGSKCDLLGAMLPLSGATGTQFKSMLGHAGSLQDIPHT